ncbi:MAG: hypothetical protein KC425_22160 [Anaerolineales bacterium]|nr:hypothetical protein [Anaerolineales bacterium]
MKHASHFRTGSRLAALFVALWLLWQLPTAVSPTLAQSDPAAALTSAASWLHTTHQNDDGGFSSFSTGANAAPSDPGGTLDALLALSAAGADSAAARDYLQANAAALADFAAADGGSGGKTLLALSAAGADPAAFAGQDFVALLQGQLADGSYATANPFAQSLAILGLRGAGAAIDATAVSYLQSLQAADGSWDDGFGTAANVDATAMAVMALVAAGVPAADDSLARAGSFLRQARLADGWEYGPGFGANANSTALAIQALAALGDDVTAELDTLLAWQGASGAFQADFGDGPFADFFTTVQAMPALTARPYPLNVEIAAAASASTAAAPSAAGVVSILALAAAGAAIVVAAIWALRRKPAG